MTLQVTIDARMLQHSGIGTYLTALLPRIVEEWREPTFTLLGDVDALSRLVPSERVRCVAFAAPIYSIAEQAGFLRVIPEGAGLVWSPHYNVPIAYRGPLALTVHDVNHLALPPQSPIERAYARGMFAFARRRARAILFDSHFTAQEFARLVGAPRREAVVHLGVEDRWYSLAHREVREDPYFLYVGNVKAHKNLSRLIQAFGLLPASVPHRLVIVGRQAGLRTSDAGAMRAATALGDRVEFTGYLDREALERRVADCDALVVPSLYEGFGLPPLEALACGRPVAVSSTSSLPEVCGPEADYFDPLDVESIRESLLRLATRGADTPADVQRRQAWARQYDWGRCARETVSLLRSAAG